MSAIVHNNLIRGQTAADCSLSYDELFTYAQSLENKLDDTVALVGKRTFESQRLKATKQQIAVGTRNIVDLIKNSGIQDGSILDIARLPKLNDLPQIIEWMHLVVIDLLKIKKDHKWLKNQKFGKHSEKLHAKDQESSLQQESVQNTASSQEQVIKEQIQELKKQQKEAKQRAYTQYANGFDSTKKATKNLKKLTKLQSKIDKLEGQLKKIQKESKATSGTTATTGTTGTTTTTSTKNKTEQTTSSSRKRRSSRGNINSKLNCNTQDRFIHCNHCNHTTNAKVIRNMPRTRDFQDLIFAANNQVEANSVEVECEDCHERIWLHPEALSDICEQVDDEIISTDNPIIEDEFPRNLKPWPLNENSTLEEVAAFESCKVTMEDLQKRNWLHYSPRLLDRLTIYKGRMMFDPFKFEFYPSSLYAARGMYIKGKLSQGTVIELMVLYSKGLLAKNRLTQIAKDLGNLKITRVQLTNLINYTARAFAYPLAKYNKKIMLENNKVQQADETTCTVRFEFVNGNKVKKDQKSYVWTLISGPHERYRGVSFLAAPNRSASNIRKLLDLDDEYNGIENRPLRYLVSDNYQAYDSEVKAINKKLKDLGKPPIEQCACLAHARRYLLQAIESMGLLKLFDSIGGAPFEEFDSRYFEIVGGMPEDTEPAPHVYVLMRMINDINHMFYLESQYSDEDVSVRAEVLDNQSTHCMTDLFACALCLAEEPDYKITKSVAEDGTTTYTPSALPWTKDVCYLLNAQDKFMNILKDCDIPCSNNASESSIRDTVIHRKTQLFFNSEIGYNSFTALMSLRKTCEINGVPFIDYLSWAVQEQKHRLEEYRCKNNIPTQLCVMPKNITTEGKSDKNGNKEISRLRIYDPTYHATGYDDIDMTGLSVWDYMALYDRYMLDDEGSQDVGPEDVDID